MGKQKFGPVLSRPGPVHRDASAIPAWLNHVPEGETRHRAIPPRRVGDTSWEGWMHSKARGAVVKEKSLRMQSVG